MWYMQTSSRKSNQNFRTVWRDSNQVKHLSVNPHPYSWYYRAYFLRNSSPPHFHHLSPLRPMYENIFIWNVFTDRWNVHTSLSPSLPLLFSSLSTLLPLLSSYLHCSVLIASHQLPIMTPLMAWFFPLLVMHQVRPSPLLLMVKKFAKVLNRGKNISKWTHWRPVAQHIWERGEKKEERGLYLWGNKKFYGEILKCQWT